MKYMCKYGYVYRYVFVLSHLLFVIILCTDRYHYEYFIRSSATLKFVLFLPNLNSYDLQKDHIFSQYEQFAATHQQREKEIRKTMLIKKKKEIDRKKKRKTTKANNLEGEGEEAMEGTGLADLTVFGYSLYSRGVEELNEMFDIFSFVSPACFSSPGLNDYRSDVHGDDVCRPLIIAYDSSRLLRYGSFIVPLQEECASHNSSISRKSYGGIEIETSDINMFLNRVIDAYSIFDTNVDTSNMNNRDVDVKLVHSLAMYKSESTLTSQDLYSSWDRLSRDVVLQLSKVLGRSFIDQLQHLTKYLKRLSYKDLEQALGKADVDTFLYIHNSNEELMAIDTSVSLFYRMIPVMDILAKSVYLESRLQILYIDVAFNDLPLAWSIIPHQVKSPLILFFSNHSKPYRSFHDIRPTRITDITKFVLEGENEAQVSFQLFQYLFQLVISDNSMVSVSGHSSFRANQEELQVANAEQFYSLYEELITLTEKYQETIYLWTLNENRPLATSSSLHPDKEKLPSNTFSNKLLSVSGVLYDDLLLDYLVGEIYFFGSRLHIIVFIIQIIVCTLQILYCLLMSNSKKYELRQREVIIEEELLRPNQIHIPRPQGDLANNRDGDQVDDNEDDDDAPNIPGNMNEH